MKTPMLARIVLGIMLLAAFGLPAAASAQSQTLPGIGDSKAPLEIEADNGLELFQERKLIVAKGNVVAKQGKVELRADIVSASYDDGSKGQRRIRRIDAVGNVNIKTEKERLYGDRVTYDLGRELMLVTGKDMRIEAEKQTITADQSMEFWGAEHRAVARGNAVVRQDTTSMRADVIEALLAKRGTDAAAKPRNKANRAGAVPATIPGLPAGGSALTGGSSALERVRAWGNVVIRTATEVVEGDMGDYDVSSQIATLTGNVQVTRGKNKLSGDKAIVNLATGVSKIIGGKSARVRTILYPGGGKGDVPNRADAGTNGKRQDKNNPTDDVSSGEPGQRADERKDDPATPPKDSNTDQQTAPMAENVTAPLPPPRRAAIPGGNPVPRARPQGAN